jgi:7-keto-8-aminopelargonate synthetase-like enzyme
MDVEVVLEAALAAKNGGASLFCMGAAWRSPKDRDLDKVIEMIRGVRALGMETCVTLGKAFGCFGAFVAGSDSPIQPMIIGDSQVTLELAARLQQQGFLVVAIRPPTVRKGTTRLRITLTAAHQPAQLDVLLDAIEVAVSHA